MDTATATRIRFETETCSRCGGSGTMPFTVHAGRCFKCEGAGTQLTKAGLAAAKRRTTFLDSLPQVPVTELQAGDRIRHGSRWVSVLTSVDPDAKPTAWSGAEMTPLTSYLINDGGRKVRRQVTADATCQRHPGTAAILEALTKKDGTPYAGVIIE